MHKSRAGQHEVRWEQIVASQAGGHVLDEGSSSRFIIIINIQQKGWPAAACFIYIYVRMHVNISIIMIIEANMPPGLSSFIAEHCDGCL